MSWVEHSRGALVNDHDFGHFAVYGWRLVYLFVCHIQTGTPGKFSPNDEMLASVVFCWYRGSNTALPLVTLWMLKNFTWS